MIRKRNFVTVFALAFLLGCSNNVNLSQSDIANSDDTAVDNDCYEEKITGLKIEENPENVLSCRLSFKTYDKKSVRIRYYSDDHSGYELEDNDASDHYFFLWGMRAETDYTIEIYLEDEDEPVETLEFTTGRLPDFIPLMVLEKEIKEKISEGFVLFSFKLIPPEETKAVVLMVDKTGQVVWYFKYEMAGFVVLGDIQYLDETGTILVSIQKGENMVDIPAEEAVEIDIEGNVLWKAREKANVFADENSWHHIYELLENDTIAMLSHEFIDNVMCDIIINVDRDYNEIWRWHYKDHFEMMECNPDQVCDWAHSNSVSMFPEQKIVYLNSRDQSQFYKIDMNSGDIIWTFGKRGDFTMLGDHPDPWFELAHDPEIKAFDGNEIILYDNGTPQRGYSRVIKYRIDDVNMVAEVIFEFDGSKEGKMWYTEYWGDADELENGNVLITIGEFEQGDPSKIVEVSPQGEIVWELSFPENNGLKPALYNAQKFVPELKMF